MEFNQPADLVVQNDLASTAHQDPWDWGVEEVIDALCSPNGRLASMYPSCIPDEISFGRTVRENHLAGSILMVDVDRAALKIDLGLPSFGQQSAVYHIIETLRKQSPRYLALYPIHDKKAELDETAPNYGGHGNVKPEGIERYATPTNPQTPRPHQYRVLATDVYSTRLPSAVQDRETETDEETGPIKVLERPQLLVRETEPITEKFLTEQPLTPVPSPDNSASLSILPTNDDGISNEALSKGEKRSRHTEDNIQDASSSMNHGKDTILRAGENYVDDKTGRKRRRLELKPFGETITSLLELDKEFTIPAQITKTPGKEAEMDTSADGLISRPATGVLLERNGHITPDLAPFGSTPTKSMRNGTARELAVPKMPGGQTYLGLESLSVDQIFYGNTEMGQEIRREETPEADSDDFTIVADENSGNGKRLYVNRRMRWYFNNNYIKTFVHEGRSLHAAIPYPSNIVKKGQPLSLTLFFPSLSGTAALRAKRSTWLKLITDTSDLGEDFQADDASDDLFEFPKDDSLLSREQNDIHDWDFLDKWRSTDNPQDVLPKFGDSGSENEYDDDLLEEIEKEKAENRQVLETERKSKKLSREDVLDAIDEAVNAIIGEWKSNKLPALERKARRIWTNSRRQNSKRVQITVLSNEIERLDIRLRNLRQELSNEIWSNLRQLNTQCKCMQETINDKEYKKWRIDVLEMRSVPPKPTSKGQNPKVQKKESLLDSLEDGEEELVATDSGSEVSSSALDDFIVHENMDHFTVQEVDKEMMDINQSTDHEADITMQDDDFTDDGSSKKEDADDDLVVARSKQFVLLNHPSESSDDNSDLSPSDLDEPISGTADLPEVTGNASPLSSLPESERGISEISCLKRSSQPDAGTSPSTANNFVDLTQCSNPTSPSSPRIKDEFKITTPEGDRRDPFLVAREAKAEFKLPPMEVEVIDLEDDTSNADDSDPMPTADDLPELGDTSRFAKLSDKYLQLFQERQDRKRLLSLLIARTPTPTRKLVIDAVHNTSPFQLQVDIWSGLKTLKSHGQKLRGFNTEESSTIMRLATWFVAWSRLAVWSENVGLDKDDVIYAWNDDQNFELFYDFMVECLRGYNNRSPKKAKKLISKEYRDSQMRQTRLDGSDEPLQSHKKPRKYEVAESQEALRLRENAKTRARERIKRHEEIQKRQQDMNGDGSLPTEINVGRSDDHDAIILNPNIGARIQPHQVEGVRFMWGEIVTDDEEAQGCLLAHTMGLGKTMQVISLLVTVAEASNSSSQNIRNQIPESLQESCTLVLCPPTLIDNWYEEFLMWTPTSAYKHLGEVKKITSNMKPYERIFEIQEWSENGGILLIGYSTFKNLVNNPVRKGRDEVEGVPVLDEEQHKEILRDLLERPNIIVADEAHSMKNAHSSISQATSRFRSKSRIALTGSPLSNNLEEYFSIIDWIAPNYLGSRVEFRSRFIEPIQEGLYQDAKPNVQRKGLKMLEVLKNELLPKVHRADSSVLSARLPGKTEFILRVPLTPLQEEAYKMYADSMLNYSDSTDIQQTTLWTWLGILKLLTNHPKLFRDKLAEKPSNQINKTKSKSNPKGLESGRVIESVDEEADDLMEQDVLRITGFTNTLVDRELALLDSHAEPSLDSLSLANKMHLLIQILHFSREAGDKVLVFSHSIRTLDFIGGQLKKMKLSYERLDGNTKMSIRQQLTKDFNDNKDIDICLISTKAGGQGLNLFGASRVVIMDEHFNPMYEQQAIGRAYRLGQLKHLYVYRLTVGGTFEEALQNQSLFKVQLATRVVDKKNPQRHAIKGVKQYLFPPRTLEQRNVLKFASNDELVLARILASQEENPVIRSIDFSETFHVEEDEELTPAERKEVEEITNEERLRRLDPPAYLALIRQKERDLCEQSTTNIGSRLESNYTPTQNIAVHCNPQHVTAPSAEILSGNGPRPYPSQAPTVNTPSMLPQLEPVLGAGVSVQRAVGTGAPSPEKRPQRSLGPRSLSPEKKSQPGKTIKAKPLLFRHIADPKPTASPSPKTGSVSTMLKERGATIGDNPFFSAANGSIDVSVRNDARLRITDSILSNFPETIDGAEDKLRIAQKIAYKSERHAHKYASNTADYHTRIDGHIEQKKTDQEQLERAIKATVERAKEGRVSSRASESSDLSKFEGQMDGAYSNSGTKKPSSEKVPSGGESVGSSLYSRPPPRPATNDRSKVLDDLLDHEANRRRRHS